MDKSQLKAKLKRDIAYLEQNEVPIEPAGLKIEKLDYEAASDGEDIE